MAAHGSRRASRKQHGTHQLHNLNMKLRPKLWKELKPGTRVVLTGLTNHGKDVITNGYLWWREKDVVRGGHSAWHVDSLRGGGIS